MRRCIDLLGAAWSTVCLYMLCFFDRRIKLERGVVARPGVKLTGDGIIYIGAGTKIKNAIINARDIHSNISIGRDCYISDFCILNSYDGSISIGNNVSINSHCFISGDGGVRIGNNTRIAGNVSIISNNHIFSDSQKLIREQGLSKIGVEIGDDVWIGCSAKILDGVEIGRGAIIGAGAVVTRSVSSGDIIVGIPGRTIKNRYSHGQ